MAAEEKKRMFWYWVWGLIAVAVVTILTIQSMQDPPPTSKPSYLSDLIIGTARTFPRSRMLDEDTLFVRAEATNSHTLTAYYTLVNYDTHAEGFDMDAIKSEMIRLFCVPKNLTENSILALGGTYVYVYGSKKVREIGRVEINKHNCDSAM